MGGIQREVYASFLLEKYTKTQQENLRIYAGIGAERIS